MKGPHVKLDDSSGKVQLIGGDGEVLLALSKAEWSWLLANPVKGKIQ